VRGRPAAPGRGSGGSHATSLPRGAHRVTHQPPTGSYVRFRDHQPGASVVPWSPPGSVVASSRRPGRPGRRFGKPMPVAGEAVHVRRSARRLRPPARRRSRCGLVVSPASQPPSDTEHCGRRGVVACKLRDPQQAGVGTKTRSAGRAPASTTLRTRRPTNRTTGGFHGRGGHRTAL
jgi:hypothetical protein